MQGYIKPRRAIASATRSSSHAGKRNSMCVAILSGPSASPAKRAMSRACCRF